MWRRREPLPITLEDYNGQITNNDFDEMYDRLFYHVVRQPGQNTTKIYDMFARANPFRNAQPITRHALVHLDFEPHEQLGTISIFKNNFLNNVPMSQYLKKTSFFGSSLSRKFIASDGSEYKWGFRVNPGQEWTLTTMDNGLVAHYDLRPADVFTFDVTGNNLIIYENFASITVEILASFLLMRHIALFNL